MALFFVAQCPTDWDFDTKGPCKLQFTSGGESSLYYPVYSVPGNQLFLFSKLFLNVQFDAKVRSEFGLRADSSANVPVKCQPKATNYGSVLIALFSKHYDLTSNEIRFSRDAGHTWRPVAAGHYTYEIAAHGGLLTIVERAQPEYKLETTNV